MPNSSDLLILTSSFCQLGLQIAEEKLEGPSTCLTFLGFEVDSQSLEIRLPATKLSELQSMLLHWLAKERCMWKELASLIGHLSHASRVVQPGKTFMRRLFEKLASLKAHKLKPHHRSQLGEIPVRSDILWWATFVRSWNGISFIPHSSDSLIHHL